MSEKTIVYVDASTHAVEKYNLPAELWNDKIFTYLSNQELLALAGAHKQWDGAALARNTLIWRQFHQQKMRKGGELQVERTAVLTGNLSYREVHATLERGGSTLVAVGGNGNFAILDCATWKETIFTLTMLEETAQASIRDLAWFARPDSAHLSLLLNDGRILLLRYEDKSEPSPPLGRTSSGEEARLPVATMEYLGLAEDELRFAIGPQVEMQLLDHFVPACKEGHLTVVRESGLDFLVAGRDATLKIWNTGIFSAECWPPRERLVQELGAKITGLLSIPEGLLVGLANGSALLLDPKRGWRAQSCLKLGRATEIEHLVDLGQGHSPRIGHSRGSFDLDGKAYRLPWDDCDSNATTISARISGKHYILEPSGEDGVRITDPSDDHAAEFWWGKYHGHVGRAIPLGDDLALVAPIGPKRIVQHQGMPYIFCGAEKCYRLIPLPYPERNKQQTGATPCVEQSDSSELPSSQTAPPASEPTESHATEARASWAQVAGGLALLAAATFLIRWRASR